MSQFGQHFENILFVKWLLEYSYSFQDNKRRIKMLRNKEKRVIREMKKKILKVKNFLQKEVLILIIILININ
jgi:hypothetical protein